MSGIRPRLKPSPFLGDMTVYGALRFQCNAPVDLYLEGNEGPRPGPELFDELVSAGGEIIRRYPDSGPLERQIGKLLQIDPENVIVTAGADDALERAIRSVGSPGREMILPVPTFEMIGRYALLAGCDIMEVPWLSGGFPLKDILSRITPKTAIITVVTPNSPTGLAVTKNDLESLSEAAPDTLLLVDLAYTDFAEEDLTSTVLSLPNAVAVRTLSKAWGLAGLRTGFAAGNPSVIEWMRIVGHPYAVSSLSLKLANARIKNDKDEVDKFVKRVKIERKELNETLAGTTKKPPEKSQANFVFARFSNAIWVRDALRGMGIAVRAYPGKKLLEDGIRITLPGNERDFERLKNALQTIFSPEAILFDVDDTLVDVSESYRRATLETAAEFGVTITNDDISAAKAKGDANNDWELTKKLINEKGNVGTSLADVTEKFEKLYQGVPGKSGLCESEKLLVDKNFLKRLARKYKLGIVTGRPLKDALAFLERERIESLFQTVVTMDDGPVKPDPEPIRLALRSLRVSRAWMIGDTPDDMRSARGAGVLPLGVIAPADDPEKATPALIGAGAGMVLSDVSEIEELLP